jgi:Family of unknown function (DUF5872)
MTPTNLKLYNDIKEKVKNSVNKWPSAYASGMLIKQYKDAGGTFANDNKPKRLKQWFAEDWRDIKTGKPCGSVRSDNYYPVCRPTVKVNMNTPKTIHELSNKEVSKAVKEKQKIKGSKNLPKFV